MTSVALYPVSYLRSVPVERTVVHQDRHTLSGLPSSGLRHGVFGSECVDIVADVPELPRAAAATLQLAATNKGAEARQADVEKRALWWAMR
ncbi:hypothetical protein ACWEQ2_38820 [Streptomyces sp. NPDC004096]|uniref:hypothetical protein n=1 Tax=Streptomyces sp. NPDC057746 TaxID=3346237 RepID=UPI0036A8FBE0